MNIQLSYNWIKQYLNTTATARQFKDYVSLCGPSVEKIEKQDKDFVFDIEITTNRIDAGSVVGIAREAGAILPNFGVKAGFKPVRVSEPMPIKPMLDISIKDPDKTCRRVVGIVMSGLKSACSPSHISQRLKAAGIRSLNNIVDITNYVMMELGQPVHVFDYDRLKTKKLILRRAKDGEKIVSLDNKKYILKKGDIVVDNGRGEIIDLPGIVGTKNSVVTPETKKILIFIEATDPVQIRKTSMRLGIRTVAAAYNEKNIDSCLPLPALKRAVELYQKIHKAKVRSEIIDIYHQPPKPKKVSLDYSKTCQFIGVEISAKKIESILNSLEFKTVKKTESVLTVEVPTFRRADIDISKDLIEEIARIYGYHNIPSAIPPLDSQYGLKGRENPWKKEFDQENTIKNYLASLGFSETYTYSLISQELISKSKLRLDDHLELLNPLSREWRYLQTSLIPSMLQTAGNNINVSGLKLFELSNIYLPRKTNHRPMEKLKLALLIKNSSFWEIKGYLKALLKKLNLENIRFKPAENSFFNANFQAEITAENQFLGHLGMLNPNIAFNFGLQKEKIGLAYLDYEVLVKLAKSFKKVSLPAKYPAVLEDLTFVILKNIYSQDIVELIKKQSRLIIKVELKDTYQSSQTYQISYKHPAKNLSSKQVRKIRKKIIASLAQKGWAKLKA
jgi:phenylalanyl-tRNA synthetase beta chain